MNIQSIKQTIASESGILLPTLMLSRQKDEAGTEQPWLSHWDNTKRVRITMHDDVANQIKSNPAFDGLAVKMEVLPETQERKAYTRYVVITPTSVVMTF